MHVRGKNPWEDGICDDATFEQTGRAVREHEGSREGDRRQVSKVLPSAGAAVAAALAAPRRQAAPMAGTEVVRKEGSVTRRRS